MNRSDLFVNNMTRMSFLINNIELLERELIIQYYKE